MKRVAFSGCALRATTVNHVRWSGVFRHLWHQVESDASHVVLRTKLNALHTHNVASSSTAERQPLPTSVSFDGSRLALDNESSRSQNTSTFPSTTSSNAQHSSQRLVLLPTADPFAQSRVRNYVQRILATPAPEGTQTSSSSSSPHDKGTRSGGTTTTNCSVFDVVARSLKTEEKEYYTAAVRLSEAWIASFQLPVDVFVHDRLTRRHITATGVATEAKASIIAACMHAERCLDALRIPLFTSRQRQQQRVLQAQAEGRTAAEVSDVPHELSRVALPAPVCLLQSALAQKTHRLASYQPKREKMAHTAAESSTTTAGESTSFTSTDGAKGKNGMASGGRSRLHRRQMLAKKPRKRFDNYAARYSTEPVLHTTLEALAALQSTLFAHNRPVEGDEDDLGGEQDADSTNITAADVAILEPPPYPQEATRGVSVGQSERVVANHALSAQKPYSVMFEREVHFGGVKGSTKMLDETEGGLYDLVEGVPGEWCMEPEVPGAWCLRDPGAVKRVDQYLKRVSGHCFKDSVQVHFTDEDTFQFLEHKSRYGVEMKRWYTASLDLSEIGVRATGKGTTQMCAIDLCAMHAERLLQWFGVPLYTAPHTQALYYDACLKWGRHVAAAPIDPATVNVQTANLPKPMKEWFRNTKLRLRGSERNTMEKLLALNRTVVFAYRKHLIEGDLFATDKYAELFSLVEPCVRSFMVAVQHPFESAFFNFVYQINSQYRTTIFLPLPEQYGVRGGYAIASNPHHGVKLCALSAIDVLCALDAIPPACMAQPRWRRLMEVRESFGLILPPSYVYKRRLESATTEAARAAVGPPPLPPHPLLRSPPGYRETPGLTGTIPPYEDVWRIMLLDADVFDVIPAAEELKKSSVVHLGYDYSQLPLFFFVEAASYLFHWDAKAKEHLRHMMQYTGSQHYQRHIKVIANNFWIELPLDRAVYGRRVAVGRCLHRKGAERMVYIHALRILHTLKVAPWDVFSTNELARVLYHNNTVEAAKRVREWKWLCAAVLDGRAEREDEQLKLSFIPEAEITRETVTNRVQQGSGDTATNDTSGNVDMTHIPSPHPVMSRELAVPTLG